MTSAAGRSHTMQLPLRGRMAQAVVFLTLLAGCVSLPPVAAEVEVEQAATSASKPPVASPVTTDGKRVLAPSESSAAVRKASGGSSSDLLARHLAFVEQHVERPLLVGNRSRLLVDGPQTHAAMFKAITAARESIDLETYILEAGELGEKLAELLISRRRNGVSVRVLYDGIGSMSTPKEYFERLKAADIAVCVFNPLKPDEVKPELSINNRDHRKILVVDGRIAYTGGINISGVYSSGSFVSSGPRTRSKEIGWRDTHIELQGPVVHELGQLFDSSWQSQQCEGPAPLRKPPPRAGDETMRVIAQDPQTKRNEVYVEVLSALSHAEQRAWLTFGYFVPDPQTIDALKAAAVRGVDVRLVVPSKSDVWLTLYAGRSHYSDLLASGVRIFERQAAVLHAKTAVIDGVWSTVGSSNLDWRSFVHNFEVNVVVLGTGLAGELEQLFQRDIEHSDEIRLEDWRKRGITSRVKEWFSRAWAYYL